MTQVGYVRRVPRALRTKPDITCTCAGPGLQAAPEGVRMGMSPEGVLR